MEFFTADTHFNHKNIIQYCNRPFSSVEEMNETMIENWNRVVREEDVVYHLGDFGFGNYKSILKRLNGKIFLVIGSHDKQAWKYRGRFIEMSPIIEYKEFTLCHYAMRVWNKSHYNSCHLFGHSHGTLEGQGKSFDVGVDCWNFTPLSIEQVREKMISLPDNFNLIKDKR